MRARLDDVCRRCGCRRDEHLWTTDGGRVYHCPSGGCSPLGNFDPAGDPPASPDRKGCPLYSGCLAYFPDALQAVARLSKVGNDKHNPGEPLHWSRGKSADHADALARHLLDHGKPDPDTGLSHTVAVAWRALALLQTEIEAAKGGAA